MDDDQEQRSARREHPVARFGEVGKGVFFTLAALVVAGLMGVVFGDSSDSPPRNTAMGRGVQLVSVHNDDLVDEIAPSVPTPDEVHYRNCQDVYASGQEALFVRDPGYTRRLDRDGDGIACSS